MTINSRTKGKNGELELFRLLGEELGYIVERNLLQAREGGGDTISIPGWSVEVKRKEKVNIPVFWKQTLDQCLLGDKPILFYRQSRQPWQAVIRLCDIGTGHNLWNPENRDKGIFDFMTACKIIRESLPIA